MNCGTISLKKRSLFLYLKKRHTFRALAPFIAIEVVESRVLKENHKITKNPEDEQYVM